MVPSIQLRALIQDSVIPVESAIGMSSLRDRSYAHGLIVYNKCDQLEKTEVIKTTHDCYCSDG